jgi:hypothetical protein
MERMKTIYKYPLAIRDEQEIPMPGNPVQFKVGLDPAGELCCWALVDPSEEMKPKRFFVVGTGHPVPADAYIWIGTVQQGRFMWHVFTP